MLKWSTSTSSLTSKGYVKGRRPLSAGFYEGELETGLVVNNEGIDDGVQSEDESITCDTLQPVSSNFKRTSLRGVKGAPTQKVTTRKISRNLSMPAFRKKNKPTEEITRSSSMGAKSPEIRVFNYDDVFENVLAKEEVVVPSADKKVFYYRQKSSESPSSTLNSRHRSRTNSSCSTDSTSSDTSSCFDRDSGFHEDIDSVLTNSLEKLKCSQTKQLINDSYTKSDSKKLAEKTYSLPAMSKLEPIETNPMYVLHI